MVRFTKYAGMFLAAGAVLAVSAKLAHADAIDGTWCFADGRTISIAGSTITIPGGRRIEGHYRRHSFSYRNPDGETDAGGVVSIVLIDEDTIHLTPPASTNITLGSSVQVWQRCEMTS